MFPSNPAPTPPLKERRSRRSHKNSKDGCPNCRANRIKCSEDLPRCLQCIKKNLRCGYLDFPPEKLEHIRRKNDLLRRQLPEDQSQNSSHQSVAQYGGPGTPSQVLHSTNAYFENYGAPRPPAGSLPPGPMAVSPPNYGSLHPNAANQGYSMRYAVPFYAPLVPQIPRVAHVPLAPMLVPPYPMDYGYVSPSNVPLVHPPPPLLFYPSQTVQAPPMLSQGMQSPPLYLPPLIEPKSAVKAEFHEPADEDMRLRSLPLTLSHSSYSRRSLLLLQIPGKTKPPILGVPRISGPLIPASPSTEGNGERHSREKAVPHGIHKKIKIREKDPKDRSNPLSFLTNFRSVVYSNLFKEVTRDISSLEKEVPQNYKPWLDGQPYGFNSFDPKNPFFSSELSSFFDETAGSTPLAPTKELSVVTNRPRRPDPVSHTAVSPTSSAPDDKFLPNCVFKVTKFKILDVPNHLKSNLYEQTVKDLKQVGAHIQFSTSVKSEFMRPVYVEREFSMLWVEIFLRATVYELFFIYFIDKSINILMRASEKIVNGDIIYSPNLDSSRSSSVSSLDGSGRKSHFFYNKDDLDFLTSKSFVTYGRVIRELRNSINLYSPEFPARMSLFSAWACYTNPRSDLDTFGLMVRGTLVLFKNTLTQCIAEHISVFSMHREFLIFEQCVRQSLFPDYNLNVIRNLVVEFHKYKSFVDKLVGLHEDGYDLDLELVSVICDPIFRHDFHELNKFLERLMNKFLPQILAQNLHYKELNNYDADDNIYFASPSLLFKLTYDWFYLYPDEKMYMSSKTNPLKKVMYMFYQAFGKSFSSAFSPIKSVSLADMCNITCTKVGMEFLKPDRIETETYKPLRRILQNLMRTTRFFEARLKLLSWRIIDMSVLDGEFVKPAPSVSSMVWEHNDVVQILPEKLRVREKQIENFAQTTFAAHNYPFFEELYADPFTVNLIHLETERQHNALQNEPYSFDYTLGLANHDFNPNKIVDHYSAKRKVQLDSSPAIPNEKLAIRLDNLLSSRDAISSSSKSHTHPAT